MSYLDDEDLDEGDVPPLLGVEAIDLNASSAPKAAPPPPPTATASTPAAPAAPAAPAPQKSRAPEERGGLKKGFLGGAPASAKASKPAAKSSTADLPEIKADKQQKKKSLELPEVQQQIAEETAAHSSAKAAAGGQDNSWVTPDLMKKIGANPILRKAFTDPRCQEAMTALQTNPQEAMKKYGANAEMREFLQAFMKLMGDHFTELADKQDAAAGKGKGKGSAAATPPPAGVATRETATQPLIAPAKSAEERQAEAAVEAAMRDPEVVAILQEPQVQALLGKLQMGQSHELDIAMRRDPSLVAKLRKLSQAGLIGMHWAP